MSDANASELLGQMSVEAMDLVGSNKLCGAVLLLGIEREDGEAWAVEVLTPPEQTPFTTHGVIEATRLRQLQNIFEAAVDNDDL